MADDEEQVNEKPRRRHGFVPSYLPSKMREYSDDDIKEAFPNLGNRSDESESELRRRDGSSGRVIKHVVAILVATLVWGLVAAVIWPDIAVLFDLPNETNEEALASLNAMTQEDRHQLTRAMDGWMYLGIGSLIVMLIGFTVSASVVKKNRLKHVLAVAFVIWLVNGIKILIGMATIQSHAFSIVQYAFLALLAVGLSFIFVRSSKDELLAETG